MTAAVVGRGDGRRRGSVERAHRPATLDLAARAGARGRARRRASGALRREQLRRRRAPSGAAVPFCALPRRCAETIAAGFREGRSPDVMAATTASSSVADRGVGDRRAGCVARRDLGRRRPPTRACPSRSSGGGVSRGPDARRRHVSTRSRRRSRRSPDCADDHPDVRTGDAIPGVVAAERAAHRSSS